ncbi:30S ribosome-binding factor RbfA [Alicyclobacillus macrosporangiidus]|uniref:30S ribosome-binding factor RbfA n=1 Tax=Alicyclobacillus macrosporangiidus TaxID=392015 RepID=UPI0004974C47|nr:30S ribosome-binding factor RbfA [Alicyclobacillus macrosporangiidus]MCL6597327.1 30S ribosome-binding factor RbfA [Alicyclobacillus macrosporangiidus]
MSRIRAQRVAEQMKKEIAELMRTELKDPRIGFATITRVEVAGDLQHAKVFVSVFGDADAKQGTIDALSRAAGFLRGEVARRLRMRVAPELVFRLDESGEYSAHIETVIRQLHNTSKPASVDTPEEDRS